MKTPVHMHERHPCGGLPVQCTHSHSVYSPAAVLSATHDAILGRIMGAFPAAEYLSVSFKPPYVASKVVRGGDVCVVMGVHAQCTGRHE